MFRRFTTRWPLRGGWIQQSTALALLVVWLVTAAGIPIPTMQVERPASAERFPCEKCPCGCATADYCWQKCCCHSLRERLAWAEREGIRPPASALADAARQGLDVSAWNGSDSLPAPKQFKLVVAKASCCQRDDSANTCCAKKPSQSQAACCARQHSDKPKPFPPAPGIVVIRALACQGLAAGWLAIPPALPPNDANDSPGFDPSPAGCVAITLATFRFSTFPPPVPPPELPTSPS